MSENREESKWVRCPVCGAKTRIKVNFDISMFNFPLFCPKCNKETVVNIFQFKMVVKE